jgi:hypothetical protein
VNPALTGVALAVVVGAVVAGSARDARTAVFGLVIAMLGSPFLADPTAAPLGLTARLVGAVLAGYLLWIAARGHGVRTAGSLVGWPTDSFLAVAAAVVGYGSNGLGAQAAGPPAAAAAGFALAALAILPVATGRDILRVGIGLCSCSLVPCWSGSAGRHARPARAGLDRRAVATLGVPAMRAPAPSGANCPATSSYACDGGSVESTVSHGSGLRSASSDRRFARSAAWLSATARGREVLPDVKTSTAVEPASPCTVRPASSAARSASARWAWPRPRTCGCSSSLAR